jgi:hypothetical protein
VVEEPAAHVHHRVASPLRSASGRVAIGLGGLGHTQGRLDDLARLGVEATPQAPAPVERGRDLQSALGLGRFVVGVGRCPGLGGPLAHGDDRVGDVERGEAGHEIALVVGEQRRRGVGEVGADDPDLAAGERAVDPGATGDGQGA